MNPIFDFFIDPYRSASVLDITLEILAVIFGILSVVFVKKESILAYPTGIVSTVLYVYICYNFTLYGDLIINVYYTLLSCYAWYQWTRLIEGSPIRISRASDKDWLQAGLIFATTAAFIVMVYLYFNRFDRVTDYFDTFTTGVFFAAMWLQAYKKIEHWILWILGNIVSIPLYFIKGLGFSGLQFTVFLVLAYLGYKEWKKSLDSNLQTS